MADVFEHAVVTRQGLALQAKVAAGGTIEFTKVKTGAGMVDPVLMQNQTDVSQPVQEFPFNMEPLFNKKGEGEVILNVLLVNDEVTSSYDCYQLGIFAIDPDDGEILYAIIQGEKPLPIPVPDSLADWTAEFNIYLQYGNADNVNIVVDAAGVLTKYVADNYYMPFINVNGVLWRFGMDENGVYLIKN